MHEQITPDVPDVMSYILDASEKSEDPKTDRLWLMGDSRVIIVAGRLAVHFFNH